MIPDRIGCELAVLTILCVLMIFFFPLMQGPYSVVHGPATALQAARAAARLQIIIVQGALNSLGNFLISPLVILSWMLLSQAEFRSVSLPRVQHHPPLLIPTDCRSRTNQSLKPTTAPKQRRAT
jgi:hypothetical protein